MPINVDISADAVNATRAAVLPHAVGALIGALAVVLGNPAIPRIELGIVEVVPPPIQAGINTRFKSGILDDVAVSLRHSGERSVVSNDVILVVAIDTRGLTVIGMILIANGVLDIVVNRECKVAWLDAGAREDAQRALGLFASALGIPGIAVEIHAEGDSVLLAALDIADEAVIHDALAKAAAQDSVIDTGGLDLCPIDGTLVVAYIDTPGGSPLRANVSRIQRPVRRLQIGAQHTVLIAP